MLSYHHLFFTTRLFFFFFVRGFDSKLSGLSVFTPKLS